MHIVSYSVTPAQAGQHPVHVFDPLEQGVDTVSPAHQPTAIE